MSLAEKSRRVTRREDLCKGDAVFVISRVDKEGSVVKRKKARVKDVLRKAAVLDVEGETECRTVRFSELELVREEKPALPPKKPSAPAPVVPPVPSAKKERLHVVPSTPPSPIVASAPATGAPTLDDWMSQGTRIQEQLIQEAHAIENRAAAIEAEAYELQRQADVKLEAATAEREKLKALRKRIEALDALRAGLDG